MSVKENKALVRRAIEFWNHKEGDEFFKLLAPEYVEHLPTGDVSLGQLKNYAHTFSLPSLIFILPKRTWLLRETKWLYW